jgi:hypothetical protein
MGWTSALNRHKSLRMYDAHLTKPVSDTLASSLVWSSQRLSTAWANLRARNCLGGHDEHGQVQEGAGNEEDGKRDPHRVTTRIHRSLKPWCLRLGRVVITKVTDRMFHGGSSLKVGFDDKVVSTRGGVSWLETATSTEQLYKLRGLLPPFVRATGKCV